MSHLNISANNAGQLIELLSRTNIKIPAVIEGRKEVHRERFVMAYLLATKAESLLSYPISVIHREKPDFAILQKNMHIGVECVEAVPEEWYEIQAIRERKYPDSITHGNHYQPGVKSLTKKDKDEFAAGRRASHPWMGDQPEREWAAAMAHFIGLKTTKLRSGNYNDFQENWLLVQDEWRVPVHDLNDLQKAVGFCIPLLKEAWTHRCFSKIFINSHRWLITLSSDGYFIEESRNLWAKD